MYTLGSHFMPPGFHAGGLRYYGMAPMVSAAVEQGLAEAMVVPQFETLRRGPALRQGRGDHACARIVPRPSLKHLPNVNAEH